MSLQTVKQFIAAINRHDVDGMFALMGDDHVFVDAHGNKMEGKAAMKASWAGYFEWFPDYTITATEFFDKGNTIVATGFANASYQGKPEAAWKIPAAWKAVIKNNKISQWQVFADTSIPFDVMQKFSEEEAEH